MTNVCGIWVALTSQLLLFRSIQNWSVGRWLRRAHSAGIRPAFTLRRVVT